MGAVRKDSGAHAGDGRTPVAVLVVAAQGAGLEGVKCSRQQTGHNYVARVGKETGMDGRTTHPDPSPPRCGVEGD